MLAEHAKRSLIRQLEAAMRRATTLKYNSDDYPEIWLLIIARTQDT
jgi:hypothetical protein